MKKAYLIVTTVLLLLLCQTTEAYNYGEALQKSILFYKAQRSGDLPDNYILHYRGDSCMNDGADVGLDLTGGWYDAGDHVKFGHPMAYTAAQLGWAVYEYRSAFEGAGQLDDILDEIKWATDYFIKCHPSANVYYYDCGYGESDHSIWCPPEVVHLFTERTSFKVDTSTPGSDVAGMASAALAIASIIFEPTNPSYAATCLTHAEQLFDFADTYQGLNPLDNFYKSGGYLDDLTWAAVWLYLKTEDSTYLDKALSYMPIETLGGHWTHCWDDVSYGAALKLAQITQDPAYAEVVEINLDWWVPGGGLNYTPGGLAWLDNWGSLRYATTEAFLAFVWSDDTSVGTESKKDTYRAFAESQVDYALGDNERGGSYVVGFGVDPPVHPHHRTTHCSWVSMLDVPAFHRHILYGALVGGPSADGSYVDDITDYTRNEVTDDYNAGFVGCLAKMHSMYGGAPLSNWPQQEDLHPPEGVLPEYFVRGWIQWEGPSDLHVLLQVNNRSACPPTVRDGLSARYFMDISEVLDAGYTADDVTVTLQSSGEGGTVSGLQQWSGNIYYFVLDYTGTLIHPGGCDICEKEAVVRISSPVEGGSSNDWSYQELTENPDYDCKLFTGLTEYIPIYDNGVLLFGSEPGGTTTTTSATTSTTTTSATTSTTTTAATTSTTTTAATTSTTTTSGGGCDCGICDWYGTDIPICCESCSGWGWYDGGCRRSCVCPSSCEGGCVGSQCGSTTTTADTTTTTTTAATTSTTTTAATTSTTTTAATTSTTTTAATTSTTTTAATTSTTTTAATTTTTAGAGCTCDSGCDGTSKSVPFTQNGSGTYCWQVSDSISYINSWSLNKLEINDEDYTNIWSNSFPARIDGVYYIYYDGSRSWSHFEAN